MKTLSFLVCAAWLFQHAAQGAPKRSRAEGLPGVEAANTVGAAGIWLTAGVDGAFRVDPVADDRLLQLADTAYRTDLARLLGSGDRMRREVAALPRLRGEIGLAGFLQFTAEGVPWDGTKIGAVSAFIKCTAPGNDNLRPVGVAVMAGAVLSSEEDIYSHAGSTPGFEPLFRYGAALDLDFLRLSSSAFPLKLYANYSNLDDARLVHAYEQHQFQAAAEWKGFRGGAYARWATYLYRRLPTRFDPNPDQTWKHPFHEVEAGWRWMAGDRAVLTAGFSLDPLSPLAFYDDAARKAPRVRMEIGLPLIAFESRSEALRSLLFMERERRHLRKVPVAVQTATADSARRGSQNLPLDLDALSLGRNRAEIKEADLLKDILKSEEKEIRERRKKIRDELKDIEELLE